MCDSFGLPNGLNTLRSPCEGSKMNNAAQRPLWCKFDLALNKNQPYDRAYIAKRDFAQVFLPSIQLVNLHFHHFFSSILTFSHHERSIA
jgi:hypothetical protein